MPQGRSALLEKKKSLASTEIRNPAYPFRSLFSIMTKLLRLNILLQDCVGFCQFFGVGTKMYHTVKQVIPSPDRLSLCSVFPNLVKSFGLQGAASALERRRSACKTADLKLITT